MRGSIRGRVLPTRKASDRADGPPPRPSSARSGTPRPSPGLRRRSSARDPRRLLPRRPLPGRPPRRRWRGTIPAQRGAPQARRKQRRAKPRPERPSPRRAAVRRSPAARAFPRVPVGPKGRSRGARGTPAPSPGESARWRRNARCPRQTRTALGRRASSTPRARGEAVEEQGRPRRPLRARGWRVRSLGLCQCSLQQQHVTSHFPCWALHRWSIW
jgi:hypothetical protein